SESEVIDHRVDVILQLSYFTASFHLNRTSQVALRNCSGYLRDSTDLVGKVVREQVHVAGEVLPGTGGARDVCLSTEPTFDAHFSSNGGYLVSEGGQSIRHVVDSIGKRGDFTFRLHGKFFR